jgi:predicted nuclease with TOPRIM domain
MEQNEEKVKQMQANRYAATLRNAKKYSEEAIALAVEDLVEYGLSEEQTGVYLKQGYSIGQMKILSQCLRNHASDELIELLKKNNLSGHQMQVAVEFYEKGVPIADIEAVVAKNEMPYVMKSAFQSIMEKLEAAKEESKDQPEYVAALVKEMEQVVEKISFQDKRYDELNEKLSRIVTAKGDDEVRDNLCKELESRDGIINDQQDKINQATATIARLRDEAEKKDKEIKRMENRIDTLEDRLVHMGTGGRQETEKPDGKEEKDSLIRQEEPTQNTQAVPVYYQVPVTDTHGRFVQQVTVEQTARKNNGGVAGLLSKLCFKKKSRADIVKLVASGDLAPAQLVQIKSAIEKGLTESQLVELINNNVAADKMKEIIEIAVLENSLGY